eukprot:6178615-Pleurochrysis_carterae.AAC.2
MLIVASLHYRSSRMLMFGWTMSYKRGHPVATLQMTNGTIRHPRRLTEILRINVVKAFTQAMLSDADLYTVSRWKVSKSTTKKRKKLVCKLKMAIEGGRQGGHLWQQASRDFLKSYGFTQRWGEPCIFNLKRGGSFQSAFSKLGIASTESSSAIKQGKL